MPVYDVEHITSLTDEQLDRLAEAITRIHSEKFETPRLFVNVNFRDISNLRTYVAGKKRPNNRIIANIRHGPSRTREMYDALCSEIVLAWENIVGKEDAEELRGIFVLGSIVAGYKMGFSTPPAGPDTQWLMDNLVAFKEKAAAGDGDFQDLLADIRTRPAFQKLAYRTDGI